MNIVLGVSRSQHPHISLAWTRECFFCLFWIAFALSFSSCTEREQQNTLYLWFLPASSRQQGSTDQRNRNANRLSLVRVAWSLPLCTRKCESLASVQSRPIDSFSAPLVLPLKQWMAQWGSTGPGVTSCFHRRLLGEQKHCSGGATWEEQLRHYPLFPPSRIVATAQKGRCYFLCLRGKKERKLQNWYRECLGRGNRHGKQRSKSASTAVCWIPLSWPGDQASVGHPVKSNIEALTSPSSHKLKVH